MTKRLLPPAIRLRGVRQNNLKQIDLDLPLGRLIVMTGLSGSGKSSLAFDTLFAEGQRRYIETFSPYARQFFDRMDRPQVDRIEGIPPAIAVEQRNAVRTTRSTVGTLTEICDYAKILWPQLARLHCRQCGQRVRKDSPQQIWELLSESPDGEILVTFDLPLSEKVSLAESLVLIAKQGYQRLLVPQPPGAEIVRIEEAADRLCPLKLRSLTIVQDRLKPVPANRARLVEACEQAYHFGKGRLGIYQLHSRSPRTPFDGVAGPESADETSTPPAAGRPRRSAATSEQADPNRPSFGAPQFFSNRFHCARCDIEYREPTPAMFSFNHPLGACPACRGFGRIITIDYERAIPDRRKTLAEGVVRPWQTGRSAECQADMLQFCKRNQVPVNVPFKDLPARWQDWVLNGDPDYGKDARHEWPHAWYGVKGYFRWLESKAYKMHVRVLLSRYRAYELCPECQGRRFQPETLLYKVSADCRGQNKGWTKPEPEPNGTQKSEIRDQRSEFRTPNSKSPPSSSTAAFSLSDFYRLPIRDAHRLIEYLAARHQSKPSDPLGLALEEVRSRLGYLVEVGLGYLTLDRPARSLSGGETERVNLTACLGTRLVNTLFVLDEPSVGLHPRDTDRLVRVVEHLRDAGNTIVVVEHEASVIRAADQVVDLGPGSGEAGGHVVFQGPYSELLKCPHSLTGQYLSGQKKIVIPARRPVILPINVPGQQRLEPASAITITHANRNNLKDLTLTIPLGRFVCITGVSGSGKTTLVREVLLPALQARLESANPDWQPEESEPESENEIEAPPQSSIGTPHSELRGGERVGRVVMMDQSPVGKTPRSNPAVYTGAFEALRELFAQTDLARQRGLGASAFSFNSAQGRCERCGGAGFEKIEMQFLSDVYIRCPDCRGRRYRPHILEIKLAGVNNPSPVASPRSSRAKTKARRPVNDSSRQSPRDSKSGTPLSVAPAAKGWMARPSTPDSELRTPDSSKIEWSIADLLEATVDEVIRFLIGFPDSRPAQRAISDLSLLQEVGLGYLRLGQPINTLSGGESQRLKLVRHLAAEAEGGKRKAEGKRQKAGWKPTLFLFDEPTTGLHFDDVRVLLKVFQRLVDAGHSLVVIEHNLDVIKCADWLIDLGPEAGDQGGQIVIQGTPEQVAACPQSHTGRALSQIGIRQETG